MELLAKLIHLFFGKKDTAIPNEESYESVDGELFSSPDDLESYEEEKAILNAKYILKNDPIYGTLTWSGKGRRPSLCCVSSTLNPTFYKLQISRHHVSTSENTFLQNTVLCRHSTLRSQQNSEDNQAQFANVESSHLSESSRSLKAFTIFG